MNEQETSMHEVISDLFYDAESGKKVAATNWLLLYCMHRFKTQGGDVTETQSALGKRWRMVHDHYDKDFYLTFPLGYDLPDLLQRLAELGFLEEFFHSGLDELRRKLDEPVKYRITTKGKEFIFTHAQYAPPGIILQYCKDDVKEMRNTLFETLKVIEKLRDKLHSAHTFFAKASIKPKDCDMCDKEISEILEKGWELFAIKE
ncbi:MAG: hypothetical protein AAB949_01265 [Patescibacteria group bacterium]